MSNKGLGRGLDALFGSSAAADQSQGPGTIPIMQIEPNSTQPRKNFSEDSLSELSESIKQNGVISPITVRRLSSGQYQIIAGERRWRAAKKAGLTEIPAVVVEADDRRTMVLALVENLQREDLNPLEEAEGYRALIEDFGLKQEEAAGRVGKSRPAVANSLRLLHLPETVRGQVEGGKISAGHARAILALDDQTLILNAAKKIIDDALSVRETELFVKKLVQNKEKTQKEQKTSVTVNYLEEMERTLSKKLGRKVKVTHGRAKGRIELEYYGNDDLENLTKALMSMKV
ncbi:MAG: ParB/RepB/Spo0J family partition protein [Clostridiales bacterium]|nr:ParB/RepB/Spo0J family partition protein [Clostridiales bacterium]